MHGVFFTINVELARLAHHASRNLPNSVPPLIIGSTELTAEVFYTYNELIYVSCELDRLSSRCSAMQSN